MRQGTKRPGLAEEAIKPKGASLVQDLLGRKVHVRYGDQYREGRVALLQCVLEWDDGAFSVAVLEDVKADGQPVLEFPSGFTCEEPNVKPHDQCCLHKNPRALKKRKTEGAPSSQESECNDVHLGQALRRQQTMLSPSSQEASSQEERSWEGRLSPPSSQQALLRARTEPEMGIKIPLEGSQGIQKTPSFPGETALRPPNKQELPKGPSNPTNIFPDLTGFGRTPTLFQGNNPHPRQSQSQSLSLSASEESLSFSGGREKPQLVRGPGAVLLTPLVPASGHRHDKDLSPKPVLKRTVEGQPVQNQNAQPQADRSLRHEKSVLVPNAAPSVQPTSEELYVIKKYSPNQVQREAVVASGTFGTVHTGTVEGISGKVAIKDMNVQSEHDIIQWSKEIAVMSRTRSKYVVDIYGYVYLKEKLTILMELMTNGDLYTFLHKRQTIPLSKLHRLRMALHCIKGLAFLHTSNYIHRDIKSLNILVTEDFSCKLTDFGCAKLVLDGNPLNTINKGTPLWMAPEVQLGKYTFSADVYSMGLVFYEIFERQLPGWDYHKKKASLPSDFATHALVMPMVDSDPNKRPTATQMEQTLTTMLSKIIYGIYERLTEENLAKLKVEAGTLSNDPNAMQLQMERLYEQLLKKSPQEIDLFFG